MNIKINENYNFKNKVITIKNDDSRILSITTINAILETLRLDKIKSINDYFINVSKSLNNQSIDWNRFLSSNKKLEYMSYLKREIESSTKYVTSYFYDVFPKRLSLFKHITVLNEGEEAAVYKHSNITGRLSMEKGINYLTMKKEHKKLLRSPFKDHQIIELDFKSCEPNLYARYFNLVPEDTIDIYTYLASEIGINIDSRADLKRIVLSILYGANERAMSKHTNIDIKKIKQIKQILNVNNFESMLKKEYNEKGFIENLYNRPVLSDANLVNYWIQSSAVDFCCLAFLNLFKKHKNIKLHAVIHDAILFSVHNDEIDVIKNIKSLGHGNLYIPVEIKLIG